MATGTILLVASDNAVLQSLGAMLRSRGYHVTPISCQEGSRRIPSEAKFDYVFVDVVAKTPYLTIFRHFRIADPSTKFVFISDRLARYCQQRDTELTNVPIVLDFPCSPEELDRALQHVALAKSCHELVGQDIFREVPWLDPGCQVGDAIRYMYAHDVGAVGCIENGVVKGLLSFYGLISEAFDPTKDFVNRRLGEVVSCDFVLLNTSPSREEVSRSIAEGWRYGLIVDESSSGRLVNLSRLRSYCEEVDQEQNVLKMMDPATLAKLAAASGDYHAIVDPCGEILHANRRLQRDFLGRGITNFFKLVGHLANGSERVSADPSIVESYESTIKTDKGQAKAVRWEVVGDGRLFFVRGVDQTKLRNATQQIAEAHEASFRNQKFSILGELAASILPALRSPITTLQFKLESARQSAPEGTALAAKLQETEKVLAQMGNIVEALGELACDQDHKSRNWVSLQAIIGRAQELLETKVKRSACEFRMDLDPAELFCNRDALVQVFSSLFSDAIDALFDFSNREIVVEARLQARGRVAVSIASRIRGTQTDFTTLYKPFDLGSPGLPITRQVVHDHQGEIWSEVVGSVRHFYLILKGRKVIEAISFAD